MDTPNIWDFVSTYYPNYYRSEEIARNSDLLKLVERDFEDGDSASKLLETYEWADLNNPHIEADYNESCKSIYEKAIAGYLLTLKSN